MNSNHMKKFQKTTQTQSLLPSSSGKVVISRKSIDPSTEVAEPHLLLEENSFPHSSTIAKDNDPKRVDTLIEAIHADILKKEEQQPQKSSFQLSSRKSVPVATAIDTQPSPNKITKPISSTEQHSRRTVTFDDDKTPFQSISNRPIEAPHVNVLLPNHDSSPNDEPETELVDSSPMNFTMQDLNNLVSTFTFILLNDLFSI
jgi:hypothetical protein